MPYDLFERCWLPIKRMEKLHPHNYSKYCVWVCLDVNFTYKFYTLTWNNLFAYQGGHVHKNDRTEEQCPEMYFWKCWTVKVFDILRLQSLIFVWIYPYPGKGKGNGEGIWAFTPILIHLRLILYSYTLYPYLCRGLYKHTTYVNGYTKHYIETNLIL